MPAAIGVVPDIRDASAKDAMIAWFRGEFAAANAIIDALCVHLRCLEPAAEPPSRYESVFAAIHRRRSNWIPVIQNQKFFSIAGVTTELNKVTEEIINSRSNDSYDDDNVERERREKEKMKQSGCDDNDGDHESGGGGGEGDHIVDEDLTSDVTDTGSQEAQPLERIALCSNHEECEARRSHIKATTGFVAKATVKGHMVNVVRGLKLYEGVFTDLELSELNDFVNELRVAGRNGELSGETFVLYNQQTKGNRRELIQLGVPIFRQIKEGDTNKSKEGCIKPIPSLLQAVVDHLCQWHLIPGNRKPNSCIINFFDEGEFSQPFLKPPHLEQPVSILLLSESTMAFGRTLVNDGEGNYRGPLMLSLKKGSLLVMRGNSSNKARHVMCSSLSKRISITFFRVRTDVETNSSSDKNPLSTAMTLWQPNVQNPYSLANKYGPTDMIPKWAGLIRAPPVLMLAPVHPMVMTPTRVQNGGGTGVFLPWNVGTRKHARQLPPRARRSGQILALPPPVETCNKPEKAAGSGVESLRRKNKSSEFLVTV